MSHILISSSVLILVVVLARYLLGKKISHRLRYALWLLVALRLLIPFDFASTDFSVSNFTQAHIENPVSQVIQQPVSGPSYEAVYADVRQELQALTPDIEPVRLEQMAASETRQRITMPTVGEILEIIWIAGICVCALWFLVTNLYFFRKASKSSRPVGAAEVPLPVRISDQLHSPCLLGFLRPAIYITPVCTQTDEHFRNVCAHEQTHWKHGDNWWALVRCVCLCIYWFNPLVWLAAILSRRDCELACDEGALKTLGDEHRLSYGKTLLDIVSANSRPANLLHTATSMNESKKQLKERISFIATKPKRYIAAILALVLVVGLAVGCTFTGAPDIPTTDPVTQSTNDDSMPQYTPEQPVGIPATNFNNNYWFSGDFWVYGDRCFYCQDGFYNMGVYTHLDKKTVKLFEESNFIDESTDYELIGDVFPVGDWLYFELVTDKDNTLYRYDMNEEKYSVVCEIPVSYRWVVVEDYLIYREHPAHNENKFSPLVIYSMRDQTTTQVCENVAEFGIVNGQLRYITYDGEYTLYQYDYSGQYSSKLGEFPLVYDSQYDIFNFTPDAVVMLDWSTEYRRNMIVYNYKTNNVAVHTLPKGIHYMVAYDQFAYAVVYDTQEYSSFAIPDDANGIYRISLADGSYEMIDNADNDTEIHVMSDISICIIERKANIIGQNRRHTFFYNHSTGKKEKWFTLEIL